MKKHNCLKKCIFIFLCFTFSIYTQGQVKLSADFTNESDKKLPIHDVWSVVNRISPRYGSNVRPGRLKMNTVRMIGGVLRIVNGYPIPQKDLDFDPCLYDSINNVYVYRWEPLIERLDKIVSSQTEIFQIVLDQPPWAFQHGYTFIPEGTRDSIHFRENERISIYGNSLPPADKQAYHDFIKAMMTKLVETYGEEKVLSWRFRVGSEIETPDHWFGTKQDFIEHFANTEQAVRSILPNAKVGVHTRNPGFLYKNGTELNYKGEPFASFIDDLIAYNYENNIKCDFWGLTDYIVIPSSILRDMGVKYSANFAPLINNPKWNPVTTLDIMEYNTVTTMQGADGKGTIPCQSTHSEIVELAFSNMFYKNKDKGLESIFRWRSREGIEDPDAIKELTYLVGMLRYETNISGTPNTSNNELDAIFAKDTLNDQYHALVYNYNSKSFNYINSETVDVSFITDLPVGTTLYYRSKSYGKENNKLQNFLVNNSHFVKSGFDDRGDPKRTLTAEGYALFEIYENPNPHQFTEWKSVNTAVRSDGVAGSEVIISTEIGSFAFEKFEFCLESEFVSEITPLDVQWTSTEDFEPWEARTGGMTVNTENDKLSLTFSDGFSFPIAGIAGLNIPSEFFDTMRMVLKNSTPEDNFQLAANVPGSGFETGRIRPAFPNDSQTHVLIVDLTAWPHWDGVITDFKIYNKVNSGTLEFDTIEFIPGAAVETVDITVEQEGLGLLNYNSGSCFAGQEFIFIAIPEPGWAFIEWTGDVTSTVNPLNIKMDSSMTIKAIFKETLNVLIEQEGSGTLSHSSGIFTDGQEIVLAATPATGWEFSGWTGDIISSENPLSIILDSDLTIMAVFSEIIYNLTISLEGEGTLSHSSGNYQQGHEIILTATPADGWEFDGWTGDTISSENPITLSIDSDFSINAVFIEPVSVYENEATTVRVYPNPSSTGKFSLDLPEPQDWEVYNILGVKVLAGEGNTIDLSIFPKGLYHLRIGNTVKMVRIINGK